MLSAADSVAAETSLLNIYHVEPQTRTLDVVNRLRALGPNFAGIGRFWVYRALEKHGWSFKNVSHKQRLKFTAANLA